MALGDGLDYSNSVGILRMLDIAKGEHVGSTSAAFVPAKTLRSSGNVCHTSDDALPANNTEIARANGDICVHVTAAGVATNVYVASNVGASTTTWTDITP